MSGDVTAAIQRLRRGIDEYKAGTLHPVWEFAPSPSDVIDVLAEVERLRAEREALLNEVKEMLADAEQINYDRAGKSEIDEGRAIAYKYVLDLMNGGRG